MAVDERDVRQPSEDGQQADNEPDPIRRTDTTRDEQQQPRNAELDQKRQRRHVPDGAEDHELQRSRLQHRIGESARPAAGQQVLAAVDEVDEVAGIAPAVEVGGNGGSGQDRYPHTDERRTQDVPHPRRYRPLQGGG